MLGYDANMATRVPKPASDEQDFIHEGPELDALVRLKVAEADADPRPYVPIEEAFNRIRANIAEADSNPSPGIPMAEVFAGLLAHHAKQR